MCYRKRFIHHRCGHEVTTLIEGCGKSLHTPLMVGTDVLRRRVIELINTPTVTDNVEFRSMEDRQIIANRYPCIVPTCPFYSRFN